MLFRSMKLRPVDNTGAKVVKCIRIISKTKKYAVVGDLLGVVVKKFRFQKKLVKKVIYYGLIISMRSLLLRPDGIRIKSDKNRIVLLSNKLQFLGTRIYGPIYKEVRNIYVGKGRHRR
jgi:large subunit ribosomal protein L14